MSIVRMATVSCTCDGRRPGSTYYGHLPWLYLLWLYLLWRYLLWRCLLRLYLLRLYLLWLYLLWRYLPWRYLVWPYLPGSTGEWSLGGDAEAEGSRGPPQRTKCLTLSLTLSLSLTRQPQGKEYV